MGNKIVLDLETQTEVFSRNLADMKVSVCGIYNYDQAELKAYREEDMSELAEILNETEVLIGFNHKYFDIPVLKPYVSGVDFDRIIHVDIMERLQEVLGYRVSLDKVATATLDTKKSGHGLNAVEFFKHGQWD